jgi:hypothetical protein
MAEGRAYLDRYLEIMEKQEASDPAFLIYQRACFAAVAKEREEALQLLRRAVELGYPTESMAWDQDLVSLRGDPEFDALISAAKQGPDE